MAGETTSSTTISPAAAVPPQRPIRWIPWAVFLGLLSLYLFFPSRHYDGDALKRTAVFFKDPPVEGSNHPFTGLFYSTWWRLVSGLAGDDIIRKIDVLTSMNSLLGAAAAALGCAWLGRIGVAPLLQGAGGLLIGLTSAATYHSTQTTEPMSAQFCLMMSLYVGTWGNTGRLGLVLGGAFWACSVACYQSYFLAGPFVLWLTCTRLKEAIAWVASAGVVGTLLFALAAHFHGMPGASGFVQYVTTHHDSGYWGFFTWGQTLRTPLGFAVAVSKPWPRLDWPGLLAGFPTLSTVEKGLSVAQILVTLTLAVAALVLPVPARFRRYRWPLVLGFLACSFPPLYLSPQYWKLWLMPVSLVLLLGVLVASERTLGPKVILGALALLGFANIPRILVQGNNPDSPSIRLSRALEQWVKPNDLLICDGWDHSGLYIAVHPDQNRLILMNHHDGPEAIWARVRENLTKGNRVFLYGVVERSEARWNTTDLGTRKGLISFSEFQSFRDNAGTPIWKEKPHPQVEHLYEFKSVPGSPR